MTGLNPFAAGQEVLQFWFHELEPEQQFANDPVFDTMIGERFRDLRESLFATGAAHWQEDGNCLLAAVIVLDQFSRNIFRDQAEAFAADPMALDLALAGIAKGFHVDMPAAKRAFLYMPLMHCEDYGVQLFSIRCFSEPGLEYNLDFARQHAAVIERFGRFPSRNKALKRKSTAEEAAFLAEHGAGW